MKRTKPLSFVATSISLCLLASGCGGGSSTVSSPSAFADSVLTPAGSSTAPAPAPVPSPAPAAPSYPTYFVDYQNGDDNASGKTKAEAWKHAPGDARASGVPAKFTPAGGDHIIFVAGSRYYGSITAEWAGTAEQPIVLEGEGTEHAAVIDGASHLASLTPCTSAQSCNGIANWQSVYKARFAEALPEHARLFIDKQELIPAQWPDPKDLFYSDELTDMATEDGTLLNKGKARVDPAVIAALRSSPQATVAVWVTGNRVIDRQLTGLGTDTISFDVTGVNSYTDRPGRFALRGNSAFISQAGEYAILPDRQTALVKLASPASTLSASVGRTGIDLSGAKNVTVRGLTFHNMADVKGNVRSGMSVWVMRKPASNLLIENNRFINAFNANQMGAVTLWKTDGAVVRNNYFNRLMTQSAVRVLNSNNVTLRDNVAERVSASVMLFMVNKNSTIYRNYIRDAKGVHGNGITVYLGNQNTKIIANTVVEAARPMTMQGDSSHNPAAENLLIANNLFVATDDAVGSLISWGNDINGLTIQGNVILGGAKGALKLSPNDRNVSIKRNVIDGLILGENFPATWSVSDNAFTRVAPYQIKWLPNEGVNSTLAAALGNNGAAPKTLSGFCPYVTRLEDYLIFGTSYGRMIGASYVCK